MLLFERKPEDTKLPKEIKVHELAVRDMVFKSIDQQITIDQLQKQMKFVWKAIEEVVGNKISLMILKKINEMSIDLKEE